MSVKVIMTRMDWGFAYGDIQFEMEELRKQLAGIGHESNDLRVTRKAVLVLAITQLGSLAVRIMRKAALEAPHYFPAYRNGRSIDKVLAIELSLADCAALCIPQVYNQLPQRLLDAAKAAITRN